MPNHLCMSCANCTSEHCPLCHPCMKGVPQYIYPSPSIEEQLREQIVSLRNRVRALEASNRNLRDHRCPNPWIPPYQPWYADRPWREPRRFRIG